MMSSSSLDGRAIVHTIDSGLAPKVETLCKLTQQCSVRAAESGSAITLLSTEQSRISELLTLFGHIKHIQTALSKLSIPCIDDQTVIECAALLNSVGHLALEAYEIRYGQDVKKDAQETKERALSILNCKLRSLFDGPDEAVQKAELRNVIESYKLIGAAEDGQKLTADLLLCQFRSILKEKSALLANVQFPFNARLSMIFDYMSLMIEWNIENLPECHSVNAPLLEESSALASDVLDQFGDGVLSAAGLTDLRLLDLALTEAVSLLRQSLAFKIRYMDTINCNFHQNSPSFGELSLNAALSRLMIRYVDREQLYFKLASSAAMQIAKDDALFDDVIFIATKAVRRCISTMNVESIESLLSSYNQLAGTELIDIIRKMGNRTAVLNTMAIYSSLLETSVQKLESDIISLRDDFWSSKNKQVITTSAVQSNLMDIRRISDNIENQLNSALTKQFKENKLFMEKMEKIFGQMSDELVDKEALVDALSTAVTQSCSNLKSETIKRVYFVVAQIFCEQISKLVKTGGTYINMRAVMKFDSYFGEMTDNASNDLFMSLVPNFH